MANEEMQLAKVRWRYIRMMASSYVEVLKSKTFPVEIVNPLPADTKVVRTGTDALGTLIIMIESSEFEEINEGEEVPFHGDIFFKRLEFDSKVN